MNPQQNYFLILSDHIKQKYFDQKTMVTLKSSLHRYSIDPAEKELEMFCDEGKKVRKEGWLTARSGKQTRVCNL